MVCLREQFPAKSAVCESPDVDHDIQGRPGCGVATLVALITFDEGIRTHKELNQVTKETHADCFYSRLRLQPAVVAMSLESAGKADLCLHKHILGTMQGLPAGLLCCRVLL